MGGSGGQKLSSGRSQVGRLWDFEAGWVIRAMGLQADRWRSDPRRASEDGGQSRGQESPSPEGQLDFGWGTVSEGRDAVPPPECADTGRGDDRGAWGRAEERSARHGLAVSEPD